MQVSAYTDIDIFIVELRLSGTSPNTMGKNITNLRADINGVHCFVYFGMYTSIFTPSPRSVQSTRLGHGRPPSCLLSSCSFVQPLPTEKIEPHNLSQDKQPTGVQ